MFWVRTISLLCGKCWPRDDSFWKTKALPFDSEMLYCRCLCCCRFYSFVLKNVLAPIRSDVRPTGRRFIEHFIGNHICIWVFSTVSLPRIYPLLWWDCSHHFTNVLIGLSSLAMTTYSVLEMTDHFQVAYVFVCLLTISLVIAVIASVIRRSSQCVQCAHTIIWYNFD